MPLLLSATPVTSTAKSIMLKRMIYTFAERGGKDSDKDKDKYKHKDSTKDAEKETLITFADRA